MASTDFSLIVRLPEEGLTRFDLSGERTTLGRGPDNDIQILVSEVSVSHAEFTTAGEAARIVDKGSTNGTLLNGTKVGPEGVEITPMSKLVLGATIDGYLVPSAVLASTPMEELAATIDANATKPETAPVAVAAASGAKPAVAIAAPASAAPGAQTVRLDQVKPTAKPGPVAPKAPGAPPAPLKPPGAPGAPKIAAPIPGGPPAPAAPKLPAPAAPGQSAPPPPPAPGGAPAPGVRPAAPVPLKRPAPGGGAPPPAPNAPTIALPKTPPKPGGQ